MHTCICTYVCVCSLTKYLPYSKWFCVLIVIIITIFTSHMCVCTTYNSCKHFVHITSFMMGFPGGLDSKKSACNAGDLGSIPGLGRFPGEGNGNPLQYSCLENSMDRGAW